MANKNAVSEGRITTPEFRLAFPNIFTPAANLQGKLKYSIVMLFDEKLWADGELDGLRALVDEVIQKQWGKKPDPFLSPFKSGSEKSYDGYEGTIYASAASEYIRPAVDGGNAAKKIKPSEIINPAEIYAGLYARASVNAYGWSVMGKSGVSFGFLALQKLRDGKPFSKFAGAEQDFDSVQPELSDFPIETEDASAELL